MRFWLFIQWTNKLANQTHELRLLILTVSSVPTDYAFVQYQCCAYIIKPAVDTLTKIVSAFIKSQIVVKCWRMIPLVMKFTDRHTNYFHSPQSWPCECLADLNIDFALKLHHNTLLKEEHCHFFTYWAAAHWWSPAPACDCHVLQTLRSQR